MAADGWARTTGEVGSAATSGPGLPIWDGIAMPLDSVPMVAITGRVPAVCWAPMPSRRPMCWASPCRGETQCIGPGCGRIAPIGRGGVSDRPRRPSGTGSPDILKDVLNREWTGEWSLRLRSPPPRPTELAHSTPATCFGKRVVLWPMWGRGSVGPGCRRVAGLPRCNGNAHGSNLKALGSLPVRSNPSECWECTD